MTGYLLLLGLGAACLAFLYWRRLRGPHLTLAAAALLFGGAGYALSGKPWLESRPVAGRPALPAPMSLKGAREAFYGRFTWLDRWAVLSESYAARGRTGEAARLLRSGLREHPGSGALWSLYGNALADHAGTVSPAAELAYDRGIALAPDHPGPRFFKALALLRSGEREAALPLLEALEQEAPAEADWRPLVEGALALARQDVPPAQPSSGS
ncbi:tetratricopeptide repeat protein [Sphingomicrobium astaxanthinifaciens]|uniref:tetratricopeptide repeat protein n=1 Tax=Sphingomicrobium astaxanthinifaciens TaxID=1227949 RepID=UPI001FCB3CEC|nr:tetratricopeptide repeat protein [Sphingomicrobium astaxanthinifaciens]MCJ7420255.1 cytochrome C biosynthesis protein [Sphingomicrobium astaxanthinifaciens]